jgi:hypothetical protein
MHGVKVLMAKNYIDNLSEAVKKGLHTKATQNLWPSFGLLWRIRSCEQQGEQEGIRQFFAGTVRRLLKQWRSIPCAPGSSRCQRMLAFGHGQETSHGIGPTSLLVACCYQDSVLPILWCAAIPPSC